MNQIIIGAAVGIQYTLIYRMIIKKKITILLKFFENKNKDAKRMKIIIILHILVFTLLIIPIIIYIL